MGVLPVHRVAPQGDLTNSNGSNSALVLPSLALGQTQCGTGAPVYTRSDVAGPFFEPNAPKDKELAPRNELNDRNQFVLLEGQVLGTDCQGVGGALVEVWYAGWKSGNVGYTFPGKDDELWYRGKVEADSQGRYSFKATYPREYVGRPILHYHYKVTAGEREFITQAYFKGGVPPSYEDYVKGRESQFPKVEDIPEGRRVTFDIRIKCTAGQ